MTTDRDTKIYKDWFEKWKCGNIKQIEKAYFQHQEFSYTIAARRLKDMANNGWLSIFHDTATNKNIYIYKDKNEKIHIPSQSKMLILDCLAEMMYSGFTIEQFQIEKYWMGGDIRSDAFVIFTARNGAGVQRRFHYFIEVQLANHPNNLKKYETLYESREVQNLLKKDLFPRIMFISDKNYANTNVECTEVVKLDTQLNHFYSILLVKEKEIIV